MFLAKWQSNFKVKSTINSTKVYWVFGFNVCSCVCFDIYLSGILSIHLHTLEKKHFDTVNIDGIGSQEQDVISEPITYWHECI